MPLTEEQLQKRRQGVGASEVAAILGVSPWKRPIDVQRDKLGLSERSPSTPDTERGDFDELALRPWYAHRYSRRVEISTTLQREDKPLLIATPDGISHPLEGEGDSYLLEMKSPGLHTQWDWGEDGTDQIPLYTVPQILWGLAVTGLKAAHVVARVRCEMRMYVIPFDQDVFDQIYAQVEAFWKRHVVNKQPCVPDDSDRFAEHLAKTYSTRVPSPAFEAPAKGNVWAKRLMVANRHKKKAESAIQLAKNNLKVIMASNERMKTDLGVCTWKRNGNTERVDYRAVFADAKVPGEVIRRHTKVQPGPLVFRDYFHE